MGSDDGRRSSGPAQSRACSEGERGGRLRDEEDRPRPVRGARARAGGAAPEGGGAGSHSRPGRRAPLKWPQLHTPTRG